MTQDSIDPQEREPSWIEFLLYAAVSTMFFVVAVGKGSGLLYLVLFLAALPAGSAHRIFRGRPKASKGNLGYFWIVAGIVALLTTIFSEDQLPLIAAPLGGYIIGYAWSNLRRWQRE